MRALSTVLVALVAAGCTKAKPDRTQAPGSPAGTRRVVATVEGVFDGSRLTFRPGSTTAAAAGLVEIPVVQDGNPGTNPPDTIELVTEWVDFGGTDACGPGVGSFDAWVTLRSFYAHRALLNPYFEIVRMTPAGREACNSASPAPAGTTNQYGLFAYGAVDRLGTAGNAQGALWRFRLPDMAPFVFTGRVVADVLEDLVAPVTTVSPPPGTYRWPIQVTAMCIDDPAGFGCGVIHYTTDGSTPSLASPVVPGSITISETTTLKLFGVDAFGNEEQVQTLTYVIDQTPPTVVATSPAAFGILPTDGQPISFTFSEPVDPASVLVGLCYGACWNNYGPFTPDATGTTFTFTPPLPFWPGTVLKLDVTSARDLVGHWMDAPFTTRFAVGGVAPLDYTSGPAQLSNQALVSSFHAGTVALWSEWSGGGSRLWAARRPAGQGWHAPVLLDAAPTSAPISARVHDTDWGLLVAWSTDTVTRAALFSGASDAPDWVADVFPTPTAPGDLDVTQAPGGLAVVRAAGEKLQVSYGIETGEWTAQRDLDSDWRGFRWPRIAWAPPPEVGLNPRMRVFYAAFGGYTLRVVGEDPMALFGWGAPTYVPGLDFQSPLTVPPIAFDTPGGVEVVWAQPSGATSGGIRSAEQLPGEPLPTWVERVIQPGQPIGYGPNAATELVGTGSGDYRAIGWLTPYDALGSLGWGSFFQNGAWSPAERIIYDPSSQLALGASYRAAMISYGDPLLVESVLLDPVPPSTQSTVSWNGGAYAYHLDPDPYAGPARSPRVDNTGLVTWAQQRDSESDALWSGTADGFAPEVVGSTTRRAEALDVSAAANGAGWNDSIVAWIEQRPAGPAPVAVGVAGGLPPGVLPPDGFLYSGGRAFAAGSSTFWAYAYGMAHGDGNWRLAVMPILSGIGSGSSSFVAQALLDAPEIAIAAHPDRAVVAYSDGGTIGAAVFEGAAWSRFMLIGSPGSFGPVYPSAATGGSGVLVGWRNENGNVQVQGLDPFGAVPPATFSGTAILNGPVVAVGDRDSSYLPRAAAAWLDGARVYAVTVGPAFPPAWGTPVAISPVGSACEAPQLASDGPTFLAAYRCGASVLASRFDGTAWSAPFTVAPAPLAWSLAGSPAGYRVALVRDDGGVAHAYQVRIAGTTAGAPERLDQGAGTVRPAIRLTADLGFFCAAWSQVVDDPYAAQPRARCYLE
jgi:hypothetical protein